METGNYFLTHHFPEPKKNNDYYIKLFIGLRKFAFILLLMFSISSCKKSATEDPIKQTRPLRVLIFGNSITYAPHNAAIGWQCDCGMAASAADNDYVHLLSARFKLANSASITVAKNIAEFESEFDTYDFADSLKQYIDTKPDIIIMRLGENVTRIADSALFDRKYASLINYLRTNDPGVKILAAGPVWLNRDMADRVMRKYSDHISLISLQTDQSNFAAGLFTDIAVQRHPSDRGMKSISDQIWHALQKWL